MIGPGGLAAGIVLLLVLVVLLVLLVLGVVLLLLQRGQRRRGDSTRAAGIAGTVLVAIALGVPVAAFAWAALTNAPDPLELDLRDGMRESELHGDDLPGFEGFYQYESDEVRIRLTDSRRIVLHDVTTVATVEDGAVDSVSESTIATSPARARRLARGWADQLDVRVGDAERIGDAEVTVSIQDVADGAKAIPRVRIEL